MLPIRRQSNKREIQVAQKTNMLHLSSRSLTAVPVIAFQMADLVRLDLSHNDISRIPDEISQLRKLQQLWLNDNPPLAALPASLEMCNKLRMIDIRRTAIPALPVELGRLKHIVNVDMRETPLADYLAEKHEEDCGRRVGCAASRVRFRALHTSPASYRLRRHSRRKCPHAYALNGRRRRQDLHLCSMA